MGGNLMPGIPYIQIRNVSKVFPPSVLALDHVSIDIFKGEIHSIIGENGAGKSTLMKVLYGMERLTGGEILINGKKEQIDSPQDAVVKGIGMVHQEFMLIPNYTVLENIVLGYEDTRKFGLLDFKQARVKILALAKKIDLEIDPDEKVGNLSIAVQQKIEILKQLYRSVETLILDEPTAVLAPQEVAELFIQVRDLKKEGKTIIFISHKLNEILEISDRITVMRKGSHIWTKPNSGLTKSNLAEAMVGRSVLFAVKKERNIPGRAILSIKNIVIENSNNKSKKTLNNVSLEVHAKEIVGVAGIEGNGQYELIQCIIGQITPDQGEIRILGKTVNCLPVRKRREVIAYISQDRKRIGSAQANSITDNVLMTHHYLDKSLLNNIKLFQLRKIYKLADDVIQRYNIIAKNRYSTISSLSGGNQQKVILGREIGLHNPLMILDQPVRGLDVGSIEYIQERIVEQRNSGAAILLVSADLDELFSLSDRIVVMYKGRIVANLCSSDTNRSEIGSYMLGSKEAQPTD